MGKATDGSRDPVPAWLMCCVVLGSHLSLVLSGSLSTSERRGPFLLTEHSPSEQPCPWHWLGPCTTADAELPFISRIKGRQLHPLWP